MMAEKAILYDATRCTACRGCQVACKQWNENDEDIPTPPTTWTRTTNQGSYENPPDLSPQTFLKMQFREVESNGQVRWLFNRRACMHCTDAACVKVCPNGTLYHNEMGFVVYNKDTCTGCGYCVEACPFDVPRLEKNVLTGSGKMDKCSFCTTPGLDRIAEDMEPACVKTCPPNALEYGDRHVMRAQGLQRVDKLKAKGWTNASLYGDKEVGGLHVMYVLADHPSLYGLPADPQIAAATTAWQSVLQPVGWAVGGLTILGLGLNYLVSREAKLTKELPATKKEE
ncbi:4Fe-4S dicluster domain-containing protein [Chloroflexota bacterium]